MKVQMGLSRTVLDRLLSCPEIAGSLLRSKWAARRRQAFRNVILGSLSIPQATHDETRPLVTQISKAWASTLPACHTRFLRIRRQESYQARPGGQGSRGFGTAQGTAECW